MSEILDTIDTVSRKIVITRLLEAPRELVWEAMANPDNVVHWWGPNGFTTTIKKMDIRPGGVWKQVMHGPDGTDYPNSSVFREIVKPERIVIYPWRWQKRRTRRALRRDLDIRSVGQADALDDAPCLRHTSRA
jgi:uncharacterized protein YndB with AHSA1/START domain